MDGCLLLLGAAEDPVRAREEALDAFQSASKIHSNLMLIGVGSGAAYALMLAQRFQADSMLLAPYLSGARGFVRAMSVNKGALYAVLSPLKLLVPNSAEKFKLSYAKRIVTSVGSRDACVIGYDEDVEAFEIIQNAAKGRKITKTLA